MVNSSEFHVEREYQHLQTQMVLVTVKYVCGFFCSNSIVSDICLALNMCLKPSLLAIKRLRFHAYSITLSKAWKLFNIRL